MEYLETGVPKLDLALGGGLSKGDTLLVCGHPGTGKTTLAFQIACHQATQGRVALFVSTLTEPASRLLKHARTFSFWDEDRVGKSLILESLRRVPANLQVDQVITELWDALRASGAKRLVIDSVAELEHALPADRHRRSVLASLLELVRAEGVTALLTRDVNQVVGPELDFSDSPLEILAENVLLLRYVEYQGKLIRILSIIKMRDTAHDASIRQYVIEAERGLHVLEPLDSAEGLLSGVARMSSERRVKRGGEGERQDRGQGATDSGDEGGS